MNSENRCPRCHGELKPWQELNDEEQEVVRRLPEAVDYETEERHASHRWCTRCWYEVVSPFVS
ncbi:MAG TPA: hypothetical protein VJV03_00615 [Pyrinomonadaceae bacterium]|nr:hypothetical protein [Pyrinomonadaceae bacterium]